jgi:curved DNA-binding protein CbpA
MAAAAQINPYEILGVDKDADVTTIRSRHRKLVLKLHPDRVQDPILKEENKKVFRKVQEAYELLSERAQRRIYDDENPLTAFDMRRITRENALPDYDGIFTARPMQNAYTRTCDLSDFSYDLKATVPRTSSDHGITSSSERLQAAHERYLSSPTVPSEVSPFSKPGPYRTPGHIGRWQPSTMRKTRASVSPKELLLEEDDLDDANDASLFDKIDSGRVGPCHSRSSLAYESAEAALRPDPGNEKDLKVDNNPFAFTPGQLNKLINPKSLSAFYALGGLRGLEKGLRNKAKSGLSLDESHENQLQDRATFEHATNVGHNDPIHLKNIHVRPTSSAPKQQRSAAARPGVTKAASSPLSAVGKVRRGRGQRKNEAYWQDYNAGRDQVCVFKLIACPAD